MKLPYASPKSNLNLINLPNPTTHLQKADEERYVPKLYTNTRNKIQIPRNPARQITQFLQQINNMTQKWEI